MGRMDRLLLVLLTLSTVSAPFITLYMVRLFDSSSGQDASPLLSSLAWTSSIDCATTATSHSPPHAAHPVLPAWNLCLPPSGSPVLELSFSDLKYRLLVFETHYSYTEGVFELHAVVMPFDTSVYTSPQVERVWWREERYRTQIDAMRDRLRCAVGTFRPQPLDRLVHHNTNSFQFRCAYPGYPRLPPTGAPLHFAFIDSKSQQLANSSLCAVYRPVVEVAWCGKGLQGGQVGPQAVEFILYHLAIGVGQFMVVDEDGLTREALQPLINAGIVEYYVQPRLYEGAPPNFVQNLQYEVCRARYWYSAQWVLYSDTDEWILLGQKALAPLDPEVTTIRLSPEPTVHTNLSQLITAVEDEAYGLSWVVGIRWLQCSALQQAEGADSSSAYQADRFSSCNVRWNWGKYMLRPQVLACRITGHDPECGPHVSRTVDRMELSSMAHFQNSLALRTAYDTNKHRSLPIVGLVDKVKQQAAFYNISIYT
jgi:hypothetical protein